MLVFLLLLISRLINRSGLRISHYKVFRSEKVFNGIVVNWALPSLHEGSLEITLKVHLYGCFFRFYYYPIVTLSLGIFLILISFFGILSLIFRNWYLYTLNIEVVISFCLFVSPILICLTFWLGNSGEPHV